jgi:hypothetical protein
VGYHTVTVPVDPSQGDFAVDTPSPAASVTAGSSLWVPIQFTALSRLLDFQVTLSSNSLTFGYPSNTGDYTSFFQDSFINVGFSDFVAVRVTAPPTASAGIANAVLDVAWTSTEAQQSSFPITFEVLAAGSSKRSTLSSDLSLPVSDFAVPADKAFWILVNIVGGDTDLVGAYATLQSLPGVLSVGYPSSSSSFSTIGNIDAGANVFAPIQVTAAEGTIQSNLTITYSTQVSQPIYLILICF